MAKLKEPKGVPAPGGPYSHAYEVEAGERTLYIAGQTGVSVEGGIAEGFEAQCNLCFEHILNILKSSGYKPDDVVKMQYFLTNREDFPKFKEIRDKHFGDHKPASTLLFVAGLAHPDFVVEVEAIACKSD